MSEIFRTTTTPELRVATYSELARLCHLAEDTADDILLLQVMDEVEARNRETTNKWDDPGTRLFMDFYNQQMEQRFKKG